MTVPLQIDGSVGLSVIEEFVADLAAAIPRLLSGLIFLTLAYVFIRVVLATARVGLERVYPEDQRLVVDLFVTVVRIFLWFGAALALLSIVGLDEIAASLGTAAGFIALGISYALSNMIADTVAGVYLLRDPDFNPGDPVTADSVTGTVVDIDLRKSRIETEGGDRVVIANRDIDKRWTRKASTDG